MFTVGVLAHRRDWFSGLTRRAGRWAWVAAAVAVPFGLFAYVLDDPAGIGAFEAVFATAMIIGLLVLFRERFAAPWPSSLTANAFAVYVLHALVLTTLGIALSGLVAPAIVKGVVLGAIGLPLCWAFAAAVRA